MDNNNNLKIKTNFTQQDVQFCPNDKCSQVLIFTILTDFTQVSYFCLNGTHCNVLTQ